MTKAIVDVKVPLNITDKDKHLFDNVSYALEPLNVRMLTDVFVAYTGYCLDEDLTLVKESHHGYPEQYPAYHGEVAAHYELAQKNPEIVITLDETNTYLLIHHPWFNYYHWFADCIPRLWLVKDALQDMILVLPDYHVKIEWMMSSLAPFKFKDIFIIPTGRELFVKKLCLPQIKPICASYDSATVNKMRDFYLAYVSNREEGTTNLGEKIYISRRNAPIRKFKNEEAVEKLVQKYGFTVVQCEDYKWFEQIGIFSNARYLISIHGAGLTNMLFMKKNARVLELHKKETNDYDHHSLIFWYFASALDHDYYHQICMPTNKKTDFFTADLIADIDKLEENIKLML